MIYRWIWCILGIHKYRSLKIYSSETDTWFKLTKCSVCELKKQNRRSYK